MFPTLVITFREGVEALLITAIAAAYLRRTGRPNLLWPLAGGVSVGVAASAVLGVILLRAGGLGPLWEGALALVAMVLVLGCTLHLLRNGKGMGRRIDRGLAEAGTGSGACVGVFLFALLMVGREGAEAATMIASIATYGDAPGVLRGAVAGLALAALLSAAWVRFGRSVNITLFFNATAAFMVLFSLQLVVYAFHEFAEAEALPIVDNAFLHVATEPFGPEGRWGILLSYALVAAPLMVISLTLGSAWLRRFVQRPTQPEAAPLQNIG